MESKRWPYPRGHRWLAMLESGEAKSLKEISQAFSGKVPDNQSGTREDSQR
ncbi:hypothetical protein [Marinobacter sp. S6332]|uniref:hypothetical protein n=1 Tax=Marinobacter sp. S6332 TaxID=2926403 RepID=UPI001FF20A31|nr:hypothetical protein [Marinobacter sp. S6332]MCK0165220.1 hypothetical protein [Marinobacter sp. S6332]